ncbi:RNA methyltransferase [Algivirga pacifica]|uniref:RNA methyltransferase n=1 Tax=Algivirga pacifica TaxID=1162670 RepID=A0ABP9D293_9BACT
MNNRWSKTVRSLQQKKYRKKEQLFIVEGRKSVEELLSSPYLETVALFYTEKHAPAFEQHPAFGKIPETYISTEKQLSQVSHVKNNDSALAIVRIPTQSTPKTLSGITLALDDVRDPGNLGTILRIADWYGIKNIICSENCADFYNPKVIISSMGSFTRVKAHYVQLGEFLKAQPDSLPILGAFMEGENIHKATLPQEAIVVMGNESNGISEEIEQLVSQKINIPRFGGAESLNVAIATAIICDNLFR